MGIALVTGASSGLGRELAKLFAADGHSVVLVARRRDRLEELAAEIRAKGAQAWVVAIDLAQAGAPAELFKQTADLKLEIDFLVNNAAFGFGGRFAEMPIERELQVMRLNTSVPVELTHLYLPQMLARKSGRILNVGSLAGFQPGPYMTTYSATKAFVNSFTEALHEELLGTGVTCTVLAPGLIASEFASANALNGAAVNKQRESRSASPAYVAGVGYRAMMKGRAITVSGTVNKLGAQGVRFAPRAWLRKIVGRINLGQL